MFERPTKHQPEWLTRIKDLDRSEYPHYIFENSPNHSGVSDPAIRKIDQAAMDEVLARIDFPSLSREIQDYIADRLDPRYYFGNPAELRVYQQRFTEANLLVLAVFLQKLKPLLMDCQLIVSDDVSARSLAILVWRIATLMKQKQGGTAPEFRGIIGGNLEKMMSQSNLWLPKNSKSGHPFEQNYWNELYREVGTLPLQKSDQIILITEFAHNKNSISRLFRVFHRSGFTKVTAALLSATRDIDPSKTNPTVLEKNTVVGAIGEAGERLFYNVPDFHGVIKPSELEFPVLTSSKVALSPDQLQIPRDPTKDTALFVERSLHKMLIDRFRVLFL